MAQLNVPHPRSTACRRFAASVTAAVASLAAISCVTPQPLIVTTPPAVEVARADQHAPHAAVRFYDTFWHAIEDANVQAAWIIAESPDQRRLADAIEAFMDGRNADADSTVAPLLMSRDGEVRRAARITYGAILTSDGDWARLAAYVDSASHDRHDPKRDAASVESWASAFSGVTTTLSFADSVVSLPLTRSSTGVVMIPVSINGVKRHFWLDTGSSITILTPEIAAAAKVVPTGSDTLELLSSVGRLSTRAAVVDSLRLGGLAVHNATAMIVSDVALQVREADSGMPPQPVDGVIGFDLIKSLDVTIDDVHGRVLIRKPVLRPEDPHHPRNLAWFGGPIVTLVTERGTPVHMLLDTGAEETFGTPGMASKTGAHWRAAERKSVHGFGGAKTETGIVIPSVRLFLGNTPMTFERIFMYDAEYPTMFKLDGTLGAEVGRYGVVRIDMTNGRFDVSAGDRPASRR